MSNIEPLVRFYDLSGPKPWSPSCWLIRYALNCKGIPYTTVPVSYPGIKPLCEKVFPDMTDISATVPTIEILQPPRHAPNDSTPIVKLLNERFTEKDGYREMKRVDEVVEFDASGGTMDRGEYFKTSREAFSGCELKDVNEVRGGEEAAVLEGLKVQWVRLRERVAGEHGMGEASYIDFFSYHAAHVRWIGAASEEKLAKVLE